MDTVGPMKLSLPKAVFLFLKQLGSLSGLYWIEERVAEYGDVSTGAVTSDQGLPTISKERFFSSSSNNGNYMCKSHSSIKVFVRRTGPGVMCHSSCHVN